MQSKRTILRDLRDDPKLAARFWSKVDRREPLFCWEWTAGRFASPPGFDYGRFGVSHGWVDRAHRIAWQLTHGPIPKGMRILHICDNPPCVNPGHLALGTQADNVQDMWNKRRHAPPSVRGEASSFAKLTTHDVVQIRRLHTAGVKRDVIARRFRVSKSNVGLIIRRRTWNDGQPGTKPLRPGRLHGEAHPSAKLTTADVLIIRAAYATGAQLTALARHYDVTPQSISAIVRRKTWRHV